MKFRRRSSPTAEVSLPCWAKYRPSRKSCQHPARAFRVQEELIYLSRRFACQFAPYVELGPDTVAPRHVSGPATALRSPLRKTPVPGPVAPGQAGVAESHMFVKAPPSSRRRSPLWYIFPCHGVATRFYRIGPLAVSCRWQGGGCTQMRYYRMIGTDGMNRNYPYQAAWVQARYHPRREPS